MKVEPVIQQAIAGMKNNEKLWRYIRIVIPISILLIAAVYAYGRLNHRVETLEGQAEVAVDTRERVIRIEEGIIHLKEAVKRIEDKLEWPNLKDKD